MRYNRLYWDNIARRLIKIISTQWNARYYERGVTRKIWQWTNFAEDRWFMTDEWAFWVDATQLKKKSLEVNTKYLLDTAFWYEKSVWYVGKGIFLYQGVVSGDELDMDIDFGRWQSGLSRKINSFLRKYEQKEATPTV